MIAALRRHHSRRQARPRQAGFTLIELLVVIIILGILAAVVVFAVNGVGDKGRSSARAIDTRTIATAQEAFNAKNGRYGTEEELVAQQFLSNESSYHDTYPVPFGTPDSAGKGGGSDTSQGSFVVACSASTAGCGEGGALKLGWQQQVNPSTPVATLQDVVFIDHQRGWAVGNSGRILRTTDGGTNWVQKTSGTVVALLEVDFVDASFGWAVGNALVSGVPQNVILATIDGGDTWTTQTIPPEFAGISIQLDGMDFVDRDRGWIGGNQGLVLRTVNGGGTWTVHRARNPANQSVRTIHFLDATHGWAGAVGGWIHRYDATTDSWSTVVNPSGAAVTGVSFVSPLKGWAGGVSGTMFASTDGGLSWIETHELALVQQAGSRAAVDFVNERQGWSVGARSMNTGPGAVLTTVDGGVTWKDTDNLPFSILGAAQGVDFLDAAHGWLVGSSGRIFRYGPIP